MTKHRLLLALSPLVPAVLFVGSWRAAWLSNEAPHGTPAFFWCVLMLGFGVAGIFTGAAIVVGICSGLATDQKAVDDLRSEVSKASREIVELRFELKAGGAGRTETPGGHYFCDQGLCHRCGQKPTDEPRRCEVTL